jgi:hypothetical protein
MCRLESSQSCQGEVPRDKKHYASDSRRDEETQMKQPVTVVVLFLCIGAMFYAALHGDWYPFVQLAALIVLLISSLESMVK